MEIQHAKPRSTETTFSQLKVGELFMRRADSDVYLVVKTEYKGLRTVNLRTVNLSSNLLVRGSGSSLGPQARVRRVYPTGALVVDTEPREDEF